jgi:hypothetical protein
MSIPATATPSYELAATLLSESARIASLIARGPVQIGALELCVFGSIGRGIRLTLGTAALIAKRLQGEAFILGRSLFEDSLRMAEIGHDARNRKGLMLEWQLTSLAEMENLDTEAKATGLEANTWHDIPNKVARRRKELGVLAKRGQIIRKRFLSDKDAATHFGRLHDFWAYRLSHGIVHGSDMAQALYRKVDPAVDGLPQNVYVAIDTENPVLATACANWCVRSLLQTAGAAAVVFGKDPREADDAFAASNELEEHIHEQAGFGPATPQPAPPARSN